MRRIAISIAALAVACASCGGPGPLRAGDRGATAPTDGTTARLAGTEGRAPESASRPAGGGIASPGRHGARSESGRSFGAGGGDAPPVSAPEDSGTEARPETDDGSSSCNRSDGCSATENGANEPDAEPAPPTTPPNQEDPPNR